MRPRMDTPGGQTDAYRHLDPVSLGSALARLPHDHELVVASRLALEVRADAMHSGDDYPGGRYHRIHQVPEYTAVQKARWGPTGDRDLWVKYGPAGPPEIPQQRSREVDADLDAACAAAEAACVAAGDGAAEDDGDGEDHQADDHAQVDADVLVAER